MNKQTEQYKQLLFRLRAVIVAQVSKVVAKDENLICFTAIGGGTIWGDDPRCEHERKRFSNEAWEKAERSYSHYFGFATYPGNLGSSGSIYFQRDDYVEADYFDFNTNTHSELDPPRIGDRLIGSYELVPEKGLRLKRWSRISEFEHIIRASLINGTGISPETTAKMEKQGLTKMVNFVQLVVNNQIEPYINVKKIGSPVAEDEAYTFRCRIDNLVFGITHELRPDVWERYKVASLAEKMYSSLIREPAPQKIEDNTQGAGKSVGLNTPFSSLKLA